MAKNINYSREYPVGKVVANWRVLEGKGYHGKYRTQEIECIKCGEKLFRMISALSELERGVRKSIRCGTCFKMEEWRQHQEIDAAVQVPDECGEWVLESQVKGIKRRNPTYNIRHSCNFLRWITGNRWLMMKKGEFVSECRSCKKGYTSKAQRPPRTLKSLRLTQKQKDTVAKVMATRDREYFSNNEWREALLETKFLVSEMSDSQCDQFVEEMRPQKQSLKYVQRYEQYMNGYGVI